MNEFKSTSQFEEDIRQSFGVPEIRSEFVTRLQAEITRKASKKPRSPFQFFNVRPAWAIALAVLAIIVVTALAVGPQKVYAEFMRLFGYAPGAGFVNLEQVRVLENGVIQQHDGRALTALRGLIDTRGTDLWLEFSDEARPIDGAWLESSDGQRYGLIGWSYSPDEAGTHGVAAHFAPLPPDVSQVILALPEGWRLPLTWVPGSQSSLAPVNIVSAPLSPTPETSAATSVNPSATSEPTLCSQVEDIQFCLQAAVRTASQLQVLLEAAPQGRFMPGSSYSPSLFDVPEELANLTLTAEDGSVYPVDPNYIQVGGETSLRTSTLLFPGAQSLTGRLTLNIPAVLITLPLDQQLTIDLGSNPQPGQTLDIDQTIDVDGMPVHFSQAELTGDGSSSLLLKVTSDPLDPNAQVRPYLIEPGRPEGIDDRYGFGSGPDSLSITVNLQQQSGLRTGELTIPLLDAAIKVQGPFILTFDAPLSQETATPEPEIISGGTFEPLPLGEPLPMDAYSYSGRQLQPGDLLSVTFDGAQSTLYAASPASGFAPELVAILPGQVLAVYTHPNRLGIDYITGETDEASGAIVYRQLYTLSFGDPAPRLLVGQFEHSAYDFAWSYDGRFLAYTFTNDQPGSNSQRIIRLVDLDCRASGACTPFSVDTGSQDLYQISWSPVDYRIALGGSPADQNSGAGDIFLLNLDPSTYRITLENLTQSPAVDDWAPARWTPSGDGLLFICSTGQEASPNDYSLCRSDLTAGSDQVTSAQLPWNMHSVDLAGGRWLVDSFPVMNNGEYSLRTYDLQSGEPASLLQWPANGKYLVETSISPDGEWAAAYIADQGGLLAINVQTHERHVVLPAQTAPTFTGWVK